MKQPILFLALIMSNLVIAQEYKEGWTSEIIQEMTEGCLSSIRQNATMDYLSRHNLMESDLPKNFQEKITPAIEQSRPMCDCISNNIAKKWKVDEMEENQAALAQFSQTLITSRACKVPQYK